MTTKKESQSDRPAVRRACDAVAAILEKRILEGSLKPTDQLPAERELSALLGVSRPTLRAAIQQLVFKGMLMTRHGGGTFVTDRLEAHFVDPWLLMLEGHPLLQHDLLEFRQMLEGQAAGLAAERATDADIERLDRAHASLDAVYDGNDLAACVEQDVAFHQLISEAAHNVLVGHLSASLMRVIQGHIANNLEHLRAHSQRWSELKAQHGAIWRAVRERRPEDAALAAQAHIEYVRQRMSDAAMAEERLGVALRRRGEVSA
jgi:GntR family transcriptional repressor for pyruvate dehydrogenase complex